VATQAWVYAFSAILPVMCFIMVSKWPGIKYYKSSDPKAKNIGSVAILILAVSTIITLYLAYVWTENAIQSSVASVNADFSASGS
jgi:hypothetical protein